MTPAEPSAAPPALKRFILFAGPDYEPGGGWQNFRGSFDSLEDAKAAAPPFMAGCVDWWHVVDRDLADIVAVDGQ